MQVGQETDKTRIFQAPVLLTAIFYGLLLVWTVATIPPIYLKFQRGGFGDDWLYAVMIGFFYLYTWFWSLGLFYYISLDAEGQVVLKSFRRRLAISAKQVSTIQGSRFSGGFGFVKLKWSRESGYLFCYRRDETLDEILKGIRKMNPLLRTVRV
jgi:hypothetical protein